jgi:hypothetical protein
VIALAVGYGVSQIEVGPESRLNWLAFQGTADDPRTLLITISSTVVTVIALVLGLTLVALQLSSTHRLAEAAPQLPSGSSNPSRLQHLPRDVRLQRGRSVYCGFAGRCPD